MHGINTDMKTFTTLIKARVNATERSVPVIRSAGRVPAIGRDEEDVLALDADAPFAQLVDARMGLEHFDLIDADEMLKVRGEARIADHGLDRICRTVREDREFHAAGPKVLQRGGDFGEG